jgi:hypothetical protein
LRVTLGVAWRGAAFAAIVSIQLDCISGGLVSHRVSPSSVVAEELDRLIQRRCGTARPALLHGIGLVKSLSGSAAPERKKKTGIEQGSVRARTRSGTDPSILSPVEFSWLISFL